MITNQEIEHGLEAHQFCLFYQPKFSLITGQIDGSEALIRWMRPDGAITLPSEFIPIAERTALIKKISSCVFGLLISDLATLRRTNFTPVSFNVSACDFEEETLMRYILDEVKVNNVPAELIEIEITENQALSCDEPVLNNIRVLCDAGFGLAMDDYGIGYSSVDTLSKWPFSTIKIDQGLIARMLSSDKNASIVRSAIRLGHEINVEVVAEGVETQEQMDFLVEAGCKKVQGYLISKPLPLTEVALQEPCKDCPVSMAVGLVHMAIMDHIHWRKTMASYAYRNALLAPTSPYRQERGYPTLSCSQCVVGRWTLQEGQRFSHLSEFSELDIAHKGLHSVGGEIVAGIQRGAGPVEINRLLGEMTRCSLKLIESLTSLENHGLAAIYSQRGDTPPFPTIVEASH